MDTKGGKCPEDKQGGGRATKGDKDYFSSVVGGGGGISEGLTGVRRWVKSFSGRGSGLCKGPEVSLHVVVLFSD